MQRQLHRNVRQLAQWNAHLDSRLEASLTCIGLDRARFGAWARRERTLHTEQVTRCAPNHGGCDDSDRR